MIPFNKPFLSGEELHFIEESIQAGHISGNGIFTKRCHQFFLERYRFKKVLLTTSCTDALEMCALLLNIEPGDEVIVPSYTFVSTALAFVRQGAKIVYMDSRPDHPGLDETQLEALITPRTKAIIVVHYAGVACDMDAIMQLADKHGVFVVEDAAQAIDSYYTGHPLGGIGHLGTFSFHETKNIQSGEGGLLIINDEQFIERAEILWEKGTNRAAFFKGMVDKYRWVDVGSSFLPSDLTAAYLFAQLLSLEKIQQSRLTIWENYFTLLKPLEQKELFSLPFIPDYATNNGHMFYLVFSQATLRDRFIQILKEKGALSIFHYLSLHKSPFHLSQKQTTYECRYADHYSESLLRLPFYVGLEDSFEELNRHILSTIQEL